MHAVRGITLDVEPGERVAVLGVCASAGNPAKMRDGRTGSDNSVLLPRPLRRGPTTGPVAPWPAEISSFTSAIGDARNLEVADQSFDVVLLLGPLYYLTAARDRSKSLGEAVRVARPGGYVAVAAISRYAALLELAGFGELDEAATGVAARVIQTGINRNDPNGFTTAYFHRADDLSGEMTAAGLIDVRVLGVEGPSVPALDNASPESAAKVFDSAARCAELVEADPSLVSASPHFLGLGRAT